MNIIFSHCTQYYPKKFSASNTKVDFMAKGLQKYGAKVCVIGNTFGEKDLVNNEKGNRNGIKYYLFHRKYHIFISLCINIFQWIKILKKERKKDEINILFVGGLFPIFWLHIIVGKLLRYKCVLLTQEWLPSLKMNSLLDRVNAKVSVDFNNYFLDAILPISHFLWEKNKRFKKPMHIVPILADYNIEKNNNYHCDFDHFAYCADASYFRVLKMILNAYKIYINKGGKIKLILILSGREEDKNNVISYIQSLNFNDMIKIKSQIPIKELINIYETALGLIIPLNPESIQDQARFSQKIAEYVSTSRPIITSAVGEIPFYFKNNVNAYIVDYSDKSYADAMWNLNTDKDLANRIGIEGYNVGKANFDCYKNGYLLIKFLETI